MQPKPSQYSAIRAEYLLSPGVDRRGRLGRMLSSHLATRTAVYVIGPQSGPPLKIGFSRRLAIRLTELQVASHEALRFHLVCWLPSKEAATSLEHRCHRILTEAGRHIRGEWFNVDAASAAKVIDRASIDVDCQLVPHKDLVRRFPSSKDPLAGLFWE